MLYEQTVSPIHLIDIIGEYTDEYVVDYENVLKMHLLCVNEIIIYNL
ncbi:hypothetical protein JTS99_01740 [Clostridium botulinum]|nr:hypothetical protein [Clostridium botulinum]MCS4470838.1 hypothetical protein [Clostridium botulinum]